MSEVITPAAPAKSANAPLHSEGHLLGQLGSLTTRLAQNQAEIAKAQQLRFQVFYEERGHAVGTTASLDADAFDQYCDHLLVLDGPEIVGTYRLLPQSRTLRTNGFYSAQEFDLSPLLTGQKQGLLELGRSCILPSYRNKRTMELLWGGTWAYAVQMGATRLFGCASFEGIEAEMHAEALSFLASTALLEGEEDCDAAAGVSPTDQLDLKSLLIGTTAQPRQALRLLPPLLKGYLRLGARFASTAVIDRSFRTTDVLVVLDVERINPRYINHYRADASRYKS